MLHGRLIEDHCFFKIDDVDFVTVPENVLRHFGVPEPGLMAKVHPRFKHFTHCCRHVKIPLRVNIFHLVPRTF